MTNYFKILYIDDEVDAKLASNDLEKSTENYHKLCIFTVVSNTFCALECIQHTHFDVIMIKEDLKVNKFFHSDEMIKIMKNLNLGLPIILMCGLSSAEDLPVNYKDYVGVIDYPVSIPNLFRLFDMVIQSRYQLVNDPVCINARHTSPVLSSFSSAMTETPSFTMSMNSISMDTMNMNFGAKSTSTTFMVESTNDETFAEDIMIVQPLVNDLIDVNDISWQQLIDSL